MIFCVDIGNSALKCAMVDEERVFGIETVSTPRGGDVSDLAMTIRRATGAALSVDGAAVSSVAPEITPLVAAQVVECIGMRPIVVTIVVAIWVFQLIVSPIWLRHFRFGPFEWLWRSLTYMKLQPMRRL